MSCKITRKVETRKITLEEFIKQKGSSPYKGLRQIAKSLNFLLVFGGSSSVLATSALKPSWSDKQIEDFLKENDCSKNAEKVNRIYVRDSKLDREYITVADYMRDGFFKSYPGLLERCTREVNYANKHGYCRSFFGDVRNFIELRLQGDWDRKNMSGIMRNIENQAKNYRAQQDEACVRGRAMRETQDWLKRNGFKTRVWNEIHDSVDLWLHKDELNDVLPHVKHVFERKVPELLKNWVPLLIDCEISDLNAGQYYKGGSSPESFGVKWNENLKYYDMDPFNVELREDLEIEYFTNRRKYYKSLGKEDPIQNKIDEYLENNSLFLLPEE